MASEPKLKIAIGADTKDFTKGAKAAKQELNDLKSVGSNALGKVGDAVGVDTDKLEKFSSGLRGLGKQMQESGTASGKFFGSILSGINGATVGLAGLAIGTATANFKLLNDEAENFRSIVEGAGQELASKTYIETYKQAFHDLNRDIGESMAKTQDSFKEGWTRTWTIFKDAALSAFNSSITGVNKQSYDFADAFAQGLILAQVKGVLSNDKAEKAKSLQLDLYNALRKQSDELPKIASLDAQIQELREKSTNSAYSEKEQLAAILKLRGLIKAKYDILIPTQNEIAQKMKAIDDLAGSTPEQVDATNAALAQTINLRAQESSELRETNRRQGTLMKSLARQRELQDQLLASRKAMKELDLQISKDNPLNTVLPTQNKVEGLATQTITVKPVLDKSAVTDLSKELQALTSDSIASMADSIGTLISALATGGNAWSAFKNTSLSALGDLAISVGKTAIATGIATLGIKAALESLNGYVAIAAGAALVALGAAVKTSLSNAASGGGSYSSSSYVASSDYGTSTSNDLAQRDISINITGTMTAQGNALVAVLNNENIRKLKTT